MVMVDMVYWAAYIGGPVAQDGWLGPKVGCCWRMLNIVNTRNSAAMMTAL